VREAFKKREKKKKGGNGKFVIYSPFSLQNRPGPKKEKKKREKGVAVPFVCCPEEPARASGRGRKGKKKKKKMWMRE